MKTRSQAGGRKEPEEKKRSPKADTVRIPVDTINEIVVIAAAIVLLGQDKDAAARLLRIPADSFYGKGHSEAWSALHELARLGLAYDPATVRQVSSGQVDTEVLDEYVRQRPAPPPNLQHHVERIKWDRARVEVVRGPLTAFLESLKDQASAPDKIRALARNISDAFSGHGDNRYLRDPAALIREHDRELTERREGTAVYPYGIPALDFYGEGDVILKNGTEESVAGKPRLIPGAHPGDMTLLTGVSGGGKSTVAAWIALAQARQGQRVLYGAWEPGAGRALELLAAMSLGYPRSDLMTGAFTRDEQDELKAEMERLSEFVRFFDLPFGRRKGEREENDRNLDTIQEHIALSGCDFFVADLFHMAIREHGYGMENDALYRMKAITVEERCHTMLLHQTNSKKADALEDQRPTRELLKGDGAWIEVSDTIIGCHIPGLSKPVPRDRIEFPILKQRYGVWPQLIECEFDPDYGAIGAGKTIPYARNESDGDGDLLGGQLTSKRSRFSSGRGNRRL